jgi:predicted nucleic acid-binding protein
MILIDTNVVSELMRPNLDPAVLAWFGGQDAMALHLSAMATRNLADFAACGVEVVDPWAHTGRA